MGLKSRSSAQWTVLLWLVVAIYVAAENIWAKEPSHGTQIVSSDESDFIALATQFDEHVQLYFRALEAKANANPIEAVASINHDEPSGEYIQKLLAYEKKHRGKLVGLMALRKILRHATRFGFPNETLSDGKREILQRLSSYSTTEELTETLGVLTSGGYREPAVEQCLRELAGAPNALPVVRAFAKANLAKWMLSRRDFVEYRSSAEKQIERLKAEGTPRAKVQAQILESELAATPSSETFTRWEKEAIGLLTELKQTGNNVRAVAVKPVDPIGHIVEFDPEKTETMPTVAELASGLLLKELHLRIGAEAQELELPLVDGSDWSSVDQRGKIVVIQFSFTGCAPCKRMYPIMQDLQNDYANSLSLLTIMRDEELEMTKNTVSSEKITWNVHWDEPPRHVTTNWAVTSFPTVYVIDREGKIAATPRTGEALKSVVTRLLQ